MTAADRLTSIGISHRTADLDVRSRVGLAAGPRRSLLKRLRSHAIREAIVLSTCNRTEVCAFGAEPDSLVEHLLHVSGADSREIDPHLRIKRGREAVAHLMNVCAGLDSAVLGETEIVAQVKQAWEESREQGLAGTDLDRLLRAALSAGKRVRSETELCRGIVSYPVLAAREASAAAGGYRGKRVLVVGAGVMAERIVRELRRSPPMSLSIANRTPERGMALAANYGHRFVGFQELASEWRASAIVFTAIEGILPEMPPGPSVIADLGAPANLLASAMQEGVRIIEMDELVRLSARNAARRSAALAPARQLIDDEVARYVQDAERRQVRG